MQLALLILLAAAPPIALGLFFYAQDRAEPEPHRHVITSYVLGLLAVAPALLCGQLLSNTAPLLAEGALTESFILAGLLEETIKLAIILVSAYTWAEFDEPYDGILYTAVLSLGFATTENALYVARGGVMVGALRALFTIPGHGLLGVVLGSYVGRAKFAPTRSRAFALASTGLLVCSALHGLYDYLLHIVSGLVALGLVGLFSAGLWALALKRVRTAQLASPFRAPAPAARQASG